MLRGFGTLALCTSILALTGCFESTELPDGITEAAGTDTASETNADATDTMGMEATCMEYCDLIEACGSDFPQYSTTGPCMNVCMNMQLGQIGDQSGNTVACRIGYAINASEGGPDKETNCRRAGPTGGDACGSLCANFCEIADATCTGDNQQFADVGSCISACMLWPDMTPFDTNVPEGDTYACRMKHLTYATLAPAMHCSHVQDASPVCL